MIHHKFQDSASNHRKAKNKMCLKSRTTLGHTKFNPQTQITMNVKTRQSTGSSMIGIRVKWLRSSTRSVCRILSLETKTFRLLVISSKTKMDKFMTFIATQKKLLQQKVTPLLHKRIEILATQDVSLVSTDHVWDLKEWKLKRQKTKSQSSRVERRKLFLDLPGYKILSILF